MIVLTRPLPAARRFARMLRARGAGRPILFSPVLRIERTGQGPLPAGTLVFTSENGVRAAAEMESLAGRDVICVGARSAAVARDFGATATALGGDVAALADRLIARGDGPYGHLHGAEVTGDLAAALRSAGLTATARVIYRQAPHPLTPTARAALLSQAPTILPLFSARSAEWVAQDLCAPPPDTLVVAISDKVGESWPWSGAALVARSTEITGMCDAVMQAIDSRTGKGKTS